MSEVQLTRRRTNRHRVAVRGALAIVTSAVVNGILVVGVGTYDIAPGFRALALEPVVLLSALGAVGATITYEVLIRYVHDVDRTFVRIAGVALVLSFVPDVALLAVDPAATLVGVATLVLMHVIVAAASVGSLVYWGRNR